MSNMHIRKTSSDRITDGVMNIICFILILLVCYPLYFVVLASFSDPYEVAGGKVFLWTTNPTLAGYKKVFEYSDIWTGYRNTILYASVGIAIHLLISTPAAYMLSRKGPLFRTPIMFLFTFTMFFNGGLIPTYLAVKSYGMLNSIWAMVLPGCVGVYNIIIMKTFFSNTIPNELLDAAKIDGCNDFRFFIQIVLPLSSAVIAVVAIYRIVDIWNSYMDALIYLKSESLQPLQLVLRRILILNTSKSFSVTGSDLQKQMLKEQMKYCIIVVSTLPLMLLYPFLQRYFTKGVMIGAIKG